MATQWNFLIYADEIQYAALERALDWEMGNPDSSPWFVIG